MANPAMALNVTPFDIAPGIAAFRAGKGDRAVSDENAFVAGQRRSLAQAASGLASGDMPTAYSALAAAGQPEMILSLQDRERQQAQQQQMSAQEAQERIAGAVTTVLSANLPEDQFAGALQVALRNAGADDEDLATLIPQLTAPGTLAQMRAAYGATPPAAEAPKSEIFEGPDGRPHRYGFNPQSRQYDVDLGIAATAAPGQTTNVYAGDRFPTPPSGFDWKRDAQGNPIIDPNTGTGTYVRVPGGPAEADAARVDAAAANADAAKARAADIVLDNLNLALDQAGTWTTGALGTVAGWIPGTGAHDLQNTVTTIKGNIGFDRLQQMREASPTGGALGAVSDFENRNLQAVLGSLETSQSQEQFRRNLERVREVYLDIIHGPGNWTIADDGSITVGSPGAAATPTATPAARPADLTTENLAETLALSIQAGRSEQDTIRALAEHYGVSEAQIMQWIDE